MAALWFRLRFLGTGGEHRRKYSGQVSCLAHMLEIPDCRYVTPSFLSEW